MATMEPVLEPWQWSEAQWRKLVGTGACRTKPEATRMEAQCSLRCRAILRLRSRDERVARWRQIHRPTELGTVWQPGRHSAHPRVAAEV